MESQGAPLPQTSGGESTAAGGESTAGELERKANEEEAGHGHGVDLSHDLALASSDGLETSFTNYVRGYIGCLGFSPSSLSSVSLRFLSLDVRAHAAVPFP